MSAKPYFNSDDLVKSVLRRISSPLSQNTYTYDDILAFANEELLLNAVPQVKQAHQEYFVFKKTVPLVSNVSVYPIPDRALGMVLRDLNWSDASGNFFDMAKIAEEDKAYFARNISSNQGMGQYYIEGNTVVLASQLVTNPTGSLNFFLYLRPNQLVRPDRAAKILNFVKNITISSAIADGDNITITTGNQSVAPNVQTFTAIASGSPVGNQFLIDADPQVTAGNLNTAITNALIDGTSTTLSGVVIMFNYDDITTTFNIISSGILVDNNNVYIQFDQLPSTYTDPDTNQTSPLYVANGLVDFLQTNPGHRTYTYDVKLRQILAGNIGRFAMSDLQTYLNNSSGGVLQFMQIVVGDYIGLQNECIIPQIPSELHNALAERTASRVLMGQGDAQGYQMSQSKIAEMDVKQAEIINSRVEGAVTKVFNRYSMLRSGKRGTIR